MQHKLIVFSSPSGAGKTTIVKHLLKTFDNIKFSISACTRPMRNGEVDGKDYYFLSPETFKAKIANDEFVEWEEVYPNSFYGTLKSEIERIWATGNHVIFDIDVKGALNIKKIYGDKALTIFVKAPSLEILEERLKGRATESSNTLTERLGRAKLEFSYEKNFDCVVLNDNLDDAIIKAQNLVSDFFKTQ